MGDVKMKLKPCPFCGGKTEIIETPKGFNWSAIRCVKCRAVCINGKREVEPPFTGEESMTNKQYANMGWIPIGIQAMFLVIMIPMFIIALFSLPEHKDLGIKWFIITMGFWQIPLLIWSIRGCLNTMKEILLEPEIGKYKDIKDILTRIHI